MADSGREELGRRYEVWADHFYFDHRYASSIKLWLKYFQAPAVRPGRSGGEGGGKWAKGIREFRRTKMKTKRATEI